MEGPREPTQRAYCLCVQLQPAHMALVHCSICSCPASAAPTANFCPQKLVLCCYPEGLAPVDSRASCSRYFHAFSTTACAQPAFQHGTFPGACEAFATCLLVALANVHLLGSASRIDWQLSGSVIRAANSPVGIMETYSQVVRPSEGVDSGNVECALPTAALARMGADEQRGCIEAGFSQNSALCRKDGNDVRKANSPLTQHRQNLSKCCMSIHRRSTPCKALHQAECLRATFTLYARKGGGREVQQSDTPSMSSDLTIAFITRHHASLQHCVGLPHSSAAHVCRSSADNCRRRGRGLPLVWTRWAAACVDEVGCYLRGRGGPLLVRIKGAC
eukprot:353033-Chlamydomonas_euryale.AAC.2